MKSKFDYKSKRALIISLILVAIIAVASIGTVAFMRGNKDANAAENEYTENTSINGENNNSNSNQNATNDNKNTERTNENKVSTDNTDKKEDNDNNGISENTADNTSNTTTTVTAEDGSSLPSTTTKTTSNSGIRKNVKTFKTREVKVYPTTEYTQPGNPIEKKVSDSLYVGWNPIDVNAITEELNRPELKIHKNSYINNETEEDTYIHTAVTINDYITYKVSVKNISEATDAKNIHIYDKVPEGTELVKVYDGGTEKNGRITWVKDVPAQSEVIVSFVVKVTATKKVENETPVEEETEIEEVKVDQIDNIAIVDGNPTEETHNPIINPEKSVKVIDTNGNELNNQAVVPGTHLRYYITLTNNSEYDGTTVVRDVIPEGTTLYNIQLISEGGNYDETTNTITWENITVEHGKTAQVYFDITVNNNRKDTVANKAIIGPDKPIIPIDNPEDPENPIIPDEPEEPTYTNEVQTPVILARKTSKLYDGESYTEGTQIKYLVEILATEVDSDQTVSVGTAKLIDKFWTGDNSKVSYVSGSLKINGTVTKGNLTENEINTITVDLNAGDKAKIEYIYKAKNIPTNVESQFIKNNLYWATPEGTDPERPETEDETEYENPNPDTENIFKNDELVDYTDPTDPEVDPQDKDDSNKDSEKPIDTVVVEIFSIKGVKQVKTIGTNGEILDNQPVVPGSHLRYTITLTNDSDHEGTTNVSDVIPTGTTLIPNTINPNTGSNQNGTIKWNNVPVPEHGTTTVSFDVVVNNNMKETVKNTAKVGTDEDPAEQTPTNEVQTPVILARKTSKESDGALYKGNNTNNVDYLVEIIATEVTNNTPVSTATVELIDKFWIEDESKVQFVENSVRTTGWVNVKTPEEDTISNIEAHISAGEKATLKYTYTIKEIADGLNIDNIENNLYWANPGADDPERPEGIDTTTYTNPNPDTNNVFKNDELKNYTDPTAPEKDPQDTDTSNKDPEKPIDTVRVSINRYGQIKANKIWNDAGHTDQRPTDGINVKLYGRDKNTPVAEKTNYKSNGDSWEIIFDNLPIADQQGNIPYTIVEDPIYNYSTTYDGLTIKNTFRQDIEGVIRINNSATANVPVDVVLVLDISGSMLQIGNSSNQSYTGPNRATDMVDAVNATIKRLMEDNPNNRVGIELFNRQGYEMMPLGRYTAKSNNQYIKYANSSNGTIVAGGRSAYIMANVNETVTRQSVQFREGNSDASNSWNVNKNIGTNTQAGIIGGQKIFDKVGSTVTNYPGKGAGIKHTPIMILLTDGDPTHVYTTNNVDPRRVTNYDNVNFVSNGNINPSASPKFPTWTGTVHKPNSTELESDQCYGLVDKTEAIYYEKTMRTISYAKGQVTNRYSRANDGDNKTCKLYTIGMYMEGTMAKALLNPTTGNINRLDTNLSDTSNEITNSSGATQLTRYKDGAGNVLTGDAYYNAQQKELYRLLTRTSFTNYANGSYIGSMTTAQMNSIFREIIETHQDEEKIITIDNSLHRTKIELKSVDTSKAFSLKIKVPKTANSYTTYNTLAQAISSGYIIYTNEKYYLDLTKIPAGQTARFEVEYTYKK